MPTIDELRILRRRTAQTMLYNEENLPYVYEAGQMERLLRNSSVVPVCDSIVERIELLNLALAEQINLTWRTCYQDRYLRTLVYANLDKLSPNIEKNQLLPERNLPAGPINWRIENFIDVHDLASRYNLPLKQDLDVFLCLPIAILFPNQVLGIRTMASQRHQEVALKIELAIRDAFRHSPASLINYGDILLLKSVLQNGGWIRVIILAHAGKEDQEEQEWLVAPVDGKDIGNELVYKVDRSRLYCLPEELSLANLSSDLFMAGLRGLDTLRFGTSPWVRVILNHYITKPLVEKRQHCVGIVCPAEFGEADFQRKIDLLVMVDHENGYLVSEFLIRYGDFKVEAPIYQFDTWHPFFISESNIMPKRPRIDDLMCSLWANNLVLDVLPGYNGLVNRDCDDQGCLKVECFMLNRHNQKDDVPERLTNSEWVEAPMKIVKIQGIPFVVWGKKTLRKSTVNEQYIYRSDADLKNERRFAYDGDMSKISDPDMAKMLSYLMRSL